MRYAIGLSAVGVGILLVYAGYRDQSALAIFVNALGGDLDLQPHRSGSASFPTIIDYTQPPATVGPEVSGGGAGGQSGAW